ncbi:MAG: serine hydrolase domain-containing protein [Bacteroidota bacterium]
MCKSFLLAAAILLGSVQAQNSNIEELFSRWDQNEIKPGVAVAITYKGETVLRKTAGYANLEYNIPLDENSVFDLASLAKQFTGLAIAQLILEDKIQLDSQMADYFPELPILKNIQLKHLLYHSSGLRDISELFDLAYMGEQFTSKEALELVRLQRELNFPTGTESDYSNTNYVLLAKLVEKVTGVSFREWSNTHIFSPLGMKNSFANDNPFELVDNRAMAYYESGDGYSYQQNNGMALIGSSAVYSTLEDMLIWMDALQNDKVFPEAFKLMKQKGRLDNGEEIGYGFGVGIGEFQGQSMIDHTGGTPSGFRTLIVVFPDLSLSFVVLSNLGDIDPIGDFGMGILSNYVTPPQEEQQAPTASEPSENDIVLSEESLHKILGEYLFNKEMKVVIRKKEIGLTVQLEGQPEVPVAPISETVLDLSAIGSTLHFMEEEEGLFQKAEVRSGARKEGELSRVKPEKKVALDLASYTGMYFCAELGISWTFAVSDGKLVIENTKGGEVFLVAKSREVFIPEAGVASSLEFTFDEEGIPNGILLNRGSRLRNLRFSKLALK